LKERWLDIVDLKVTRCVMKSQERQENMIRRVGSTD